MVFIASNLAISLDGKIAPGAIGHFPLGSSEDRKRMIQLRADFDMILMGAATLRAFKQPCCAPEGHLNRPANGVLSSTLDRLDLQWNFFKDENLRRCLFVGPKTPKSRITKFEKTSEIISLKAETARLPLAKQMIQGLQKRGFKRLLLEGGGGLMWEFSRYDLIDERFKIFKGGQKVLDLGAAPGSWSQYASQKVGIKGRVLGVDIQPIKITLTNALFINADMRNVDLSETMKTGGIEPPFDVVLSDMAPKTTGIRITDQVRSLELSELALLTAERFLKSGGTFVCKLFHSEEFEGFRKQLQSKFKRIEILRPKSTRKESKEIFFVALQYQKPKEENPAPAQTTDQG